MKKFKKENFIKSFNDFAKSIRRLNTNIRIFHYVYNDMRNRGLITKGKE